MTSRLGPGLARCCSPPRYDGREGIDGGSQLHARSGGGGARPSVLIVDDDLEVADAIADELEQYVPVIVDSARAALALLRRDPSFAVVLCEASMSDLPGTTFYDRATEADPSLAPRFVFMTDPAFTTAVQTLSERVHGRLLEKPFTSEILHFVVDRVAHPETRVKRRMASH